MFRFSSRSLERRKGVDLRLIEISDLALEKSVIDFGIPEYGGLRTEQDQRSLFTAGSSKCDGIINISYHQTGKALDVYAYVDGSHSYTRENMAMVACAMLESASVLGYKLRWGGLWPWDMPHFELAD